MSVGRNAGYNLAGSLVPVAVSLVTIPLYLDLIGEARYGILAIVWLLLGYFGFLDLGLGRAMAQRIGALREAARADRARALWSALALNAGLGLLGAAIIWPVAHVLLGSVIKLDPGLRDEILGAIPWLALVLPVAIVQSVLGGAVQGLERFVELNLISIASAVVFQLAPLAVAYRYGPDLGLLVPAALAARAIAFLFLFRTCWTHMLRDEPITVARAEMRRLLGFGGWVTVTSLVGPLMTALDRLVIGALSGAAAVALYTVPFQLASRTTLVASALSNALFPRMSGLDEETRGRLGTDATRALLAAITPMICIAILGAAPFLGWWISAEFAAGAGVVASVLLAGFWINGLAFVPFSQLQASGRPDLVAKCHLAELVPYLAALYVATGSLGILGAGVVFSLRVLVDFVALSKFAGQLGKVAAPVSAGGALVLSAMAVPALFPAGSSGWWAAAAAIVALCLGFAIIVAPAALRQRVAAVLPGTASPGVRRG